MNKRKLFGLGLALAIVAVGIPIYRSVQHSRDLAETLSWMDQTYNPHEGGENFGQGHGKQTHYLENEAQHTETVTEDFDETFTYAKCYVTLHSVTSPVGVFSEAAGNITFKFNLRDLDPNSFKMKKYDLHKDVFDCSDPNEVSAAQLDCRDTELEVSTRNGATSVDEDSVMTYPKLQGADHESRSSSKAAKIWFDIDDPTYAPRFVNALKHSIELCGGRPSKF